jgi:WS/DGAT/MGAT family acyltransferase
METENTAPDVEYDEWMNDSDAVLWHIERDPLLRSTIVGVWLLDTTPDRVRLDAAVERTAARIPRLRQRVVDAQPGVSTPRWEDDEHFDPSFHYSWIRLPGSATTRDVLDQAQRIGARGFDKDRPLWEMTVIDGLPDGRAAFVLKVHHSIADGLGMVQLLTQMIDLEPDPPDDESSEEQLLPLPQVPSPLAGVPGARALTHRIVSEARTGARIGTASLRTVGELLRSPRRTVEEIGKMAGSVARVVKPATTPLSPALTERSLRTRLDTVDVPVDRMKAAAKATGGTLNDVFVAITLDALRRYHEAIGSECDQIRMNMPISVRGGDGARVADNQFVPARFVLPVHPGSPAERVAEVRELLRAARDEPALPHVNDISAVIGRLGPAAAVTVLGAMLKGVDITTSNVPGPPFPVWTAGARIERFYAFGPLAGAALNITLFSYDGTAHLGVHSDRAAVVDPDTFVGCLDDAVAEMLAAAEAP